MPAEFFDYDPLTKTTQYFVPNAEGTEYQIVSVQDVGPLLEANAEELKRHKHSRWGNGAVHSRVPNIVLWHLHERGIIDDDWDLNRPKFQRWINSSDNLWKVRPDRA